MFAVRRLRIQARPPTLWRGNATLQNQPTSSTVPPQDRSTKNQVKPATPEAATPETLVRLPRKGLRRNSRPKISVDAPRKWNRALAPGVLPVYDYALQLIKADSVKLKKEAESLRQVIKDTEARIGRVGRHERSEEEQAEDDRVLNDCRKRLEILEIQSEINLPSVRWECANAMVDMSKPVHRHLVEQRWRNEGALDLLMERLHQMNVIPDVIPDLHPSFDLHVTTRTTPREFHQEKKFYKDIEPGVFLLPGQTRDTPKLYGNVFHTDVRLYTMIMVDPDVPDEETEGFKTYLHWMKPNIALSAHYRNRIPDLNSHTPYIPPHPQQGTPYHRYVILLLPHMSPTKELPIPVVPDNERLGFDTRKFFSEWGLSGVNGGGAHMFREVWNEDVSKIYEEVLKLDEPRYGRPQKPDKYAEVKQIKKYVW